MTPQPSAPLEPNSSPAGLGARLPGPSYINLFGRRIDAGRFLTLLIVEACGIFLIVLAASLFRLPTVMLGAGIILHLVGMGWVGARLSRSSKNDESVS